MSNGDHHNTIIAAADDPDCATHSGILLVVTGDTVGTTFKKHKKCAYSNERGRDKVCI